MKINVIKTLSEGLEAIVFPMVQSDNLGANLDKIAAKFSLNPSILQSDFKPTHKKIFPIYHNGNRLIFMGLDKHLPFEKVLDAFRYLGFHHKEWSKIGIDLSGFEMENPNYGFQKMADAIANGLTLAQYDIGLFKTEKNIPSKLETVEITAKTDYFEPIGKGIVRGIATGETQIEAMKLVDAPASKKNALTLAEWALNSGKKYGFSVKVLEKSKIIELGLHALLAVNRGSEIPPRFIIMEYQPKGRKDAPTVGLVGKGVTYDTGGLNIKTAGMHFMKSDMGGAAAVFGTMELAVKLNLPVNLIGIVPATDNCVDANAIKPGDVIDSYSGLTIEVMDTDAEGRLILADGLAYLLKHYKPDYLIDLATLTGSAVRTLGYEAAALFTHNDDLANQLFKTGMETGERVWRLPLWDSYKSGLKSDIADVRNLSLRPIAGATEAAKFLEHFVSQHPAWVHLDIAGVAFGDSPYAAYKSGTAFGIRLLTTFFDNI